MHLLLEYMSVWWNRRSQRSHSIKSDASEMTCKNFCDLFFCNAYIFCRCIDGSFSSNINKSKLNMNHVDA